MFNPISVVLSVWKWFVNAFSHLTSFSMQKFFLVSIFLFGIGWYYIKCYETPVFETGYSLQLSNAYLNNSPSVSICYDFNHKNLQDRETNFSIAIDSIDIIPSVTTIKDSSWFVLSRKSIDLRKSMYENRNQIVVYDTARFGTMINVMLPYKQPLLFKHSYPKEITNRNKNTKGLTNMRMGNDGYKMNSTLAITDVYYATSYIQNQQYCITKDTLIYPIHCKPQWRCKGDLSSFIVRFNDSI